MTLCGSCKDMGEEHSCKVKTLDIDGKKYKRNSTYFDKGENCHDCFVDNKTGNVHHVGCDMERCPKCKDQIISCKCKAKAPGCKPELQLKIGEVDSINAEAQMKDAAKAAQKSMKKR